MAIIKKGIKVGESTYVNKVTIGGQTVYKVWSGTTELPKNKLVYYYNPTGTQGLSYTASGDGLQVSGIGSVTDTSIVVPSETYEYGDKNTIYTVNEIGDNAFDTTDRSFKITNIVLPSTVSAIASYAFKQGDSVEDIKTPLKINLENIEFFDKYAFYKSGVTDVVLNDTIVEIPTNCFFLCVFLDNINLNNVIYIRDFAFYGASLTSMFGGDEVTTIETNAFSYSSVGSVNFPNLTNIGNGVFHGCSSLIKVRMPKLQEISMSCFAGCEKLVGGVIGDTSGSANDYLYINANIVGANAFYGTTNLKYIQFFRKTSIINMYAFSNSGIEQAYFPNDGANWVLTSGSTTVTLTASELSSNPEQAANYLKNTYKSYAWNKQ